MKMTIMPNSIQRVNIPKTAARQSCVKSVLSSSLPLELKHEAVRFISRNILPDCGRVAPNCLKAHLMSTAIKMNLNQHVPYIHSLFRARIGFKGYYLDNNKLKKISLSSQNSFH